MDTEEFGEIKIQKILYISFSQDGSCICLGATNGFYIYNASPYKELHFGGKNIYNS